MRKKTNKILIGCIFVWMYTAALSAGEPAGDSFADYLFRQGEYYRAITEYHRLLYESGDSLSKTIWLNKIGLCYYRGEDYDGAIEFIKDNRHRFGSDRTARAELNLILAKSYYQLGFYRKAILVLSNSDSVPARIYNDMRFLSGISRARLFDWPAAEGELQLVKPYSEKMDRICHALDLFSGLPERKPFVAGAFSAVLPGAGYLYCGREGTALASFIINGLLIWTVRDAIRNDQYGLAAAAGFFGIGWYIGNISGSADAARAYNSHIRNQYIDRMLDNEGYGEYVKKK